MNPRVTERLLASWEPVAERVLQAWGCKPAIVAWVPIRGDNPVKNATGDRLAPQLRLEAEAGR